MRLHLLVLTTVVVAACQSDRLRPIEQPDAGAVTPPPVVKPPVEAPKDAGTPPIEDAGTPPVVDAGTPPVVDAGTPVGQPNPCGPPQFDKYVTGGAFGGFQSVPGSGYQQTITVTFPCPVKRVKITIYDPDFAGNEAIAYAGVTRVASVKFVGDGSPGSLTEDTQVIEGTGITKVELVPDPLDYVAYKLVEYFTE